MRKPERLDNFYDTLKEVHKTAFPDMRFGQFMSNWLGWVCNVKKRDIFFPEEEEMLNLLQEYLSSNFPYNFGNNVFNSCKKGRKDAK